MWLTRLRPTIYLLHKSGWISGQHGQGGRFKKAYELLNLRALKFSPLNKIHIFQCMGKIFCVEFQRYPLKFHTKYLTPYIERYDFYTTLKFEELLDLRAHMRFWNAPQMFSGQVQIFLKHLVENLKTTLSPQHVFRHFQCHITNTAQILAYLVHNMSRSQLYLGFGHFGWLPSFFGQ